GIEQDEFASSGIYNSVVLNDCRSARQLSYDEVILHVITANVQLRPVNADSVAGEIHRSEPEDAPRAHPACEDVGSASRTKTSKILAQCSYEPVIIQFWSAEKIIVWLHHRLRREIIYQTYAPVSRHHPKEHLSEARPTTRRRTAFDFMACR